VSLAVATSIPFSVWLREEPEVVATALQLLQDQAEEINGRGR
jgi:hypothetical protein